MQMFHSISLLQKKDKSVLNVFKHKELVFEHI